MIYFDIPVYYNGIYEPRSQFIYLRYVYKEFKNYDFYSVEDDGTVVLRDNRDNGRIEIPKWHFLFLLFDVPNVARFDTIWKTMPPMSREPIPDDVLNNDAVLIKLADAIDTKHYKIRNDGGDRLMLQHPVKFPHGSHGEVGSISFDKNKKETVIAPGGELFYWGETKISRRSRSPVDYMPLTATKEQLKMPAINRINITEPIERKGWTRIW